LRKLFEKQKVDFFLGRSAYNANHTVAHNQHQTNALEQGRQQ